jgi:serine-type D-Ala-D-Ala carboxypeptidase/endopeptidase
MPRELARPLSEIFVASKAPGMIAAIIDSDRTYIAGFGKAKLDEPGPPDGSSLLRINSLTKLMTGEILAALVAERKLALDDPMQRHAPRGRIVPQANTARAITIRDLAAHTAGLPRDMPPGLTRDARWSWFEGVRPLRAPGIAAQYSNAAYMMLGDALAHAGNDGYAVLLERHVVAPLALTDTTLEPTRDQCRRLMTSKATRHHPCAPTFAIDAMGGLYSTADDMARWMRAQLDAAEGSPAWTAQQPLVRRADVKRLIALDFAGEIDAIAMGWLRMHLGDVPVLQKTGGGGGFMNYVVLAPKERKAIFITVTRVDIEMLRKLTMQTNALMRAYAR